MVKQSRWIIFVGPTTEYAKFVTQEETVVTPKQGTSGIVVINRQAKHAYVLGKVDHFTFPTASAVAAFIALKIS